MTPTTDPSPMNKQHLLTLVLSVAASLAGVAIAPIAATSSSAPKPDARVSVLHRQVAALQATVDRACAQRAALVAEVNTRGDVLRSFATSAGDARQRSATQEAASNPDQSNIDFQAATDFRLQASRVHDLAPVIC
jgi:hypothetical protein